jgi:hypothetical protein
MKNLLKKLIGADKVEAAKREAEILLQETTEKLELAKQQVKEAQQAEESAKTTPKEKATTNQTPYVQVLKLEFDQSNPTKGSVELDWNIHFIELLKSHGYVGNSEEEIIDKWFTNLCRIIGYETWENSGEITRLKIVKTPIDDKRSEIR